MRIEVSGWMIDVMSAKGIVDQWYLLDADVREVVHPLAVVRAGEYGLTDITYELQDPLDLEIENDLITGDLITVIDLRDVV